MTLLANFKRKPREVECVEELRHEIYLFTGVVHRYNKYHRVKPNFNEKEWIEALHRLSNSMEQLQQEISILKGNSNTPHIEKYRYFAK